MRDGDRRAREIRSDSILPWPGSRLLRQAATKLSHACLPQGFWRYIPDGTTGRRLFSNLPLVMESGDADFYLAKDMLTFSGLIHHSLMDFGIRLGIARESSRRISNQKTTLEPILASVPLVLTLVNGPAAI
jgi:hypothetical protein